MKTNEQRSKWKESESYISRDTGDDKAWAGTDLSKVRADVSLEQWCENTSTVLAGKQKRRWKANELIEANGNDRVVGNANKRKTKKNDDTPEIVDSESGGQTRLDELRCANPVIIQADIWTNGQEPITLNERCWFASEASFDGKFAKKTEKRTRRRGRGRSEWKNGSIN